MIASSEKIRIVKANETAVAPLLRFLKATDIGGREGAMERELERGRKNVQAGEDLLG